VTLAKIGTTSTAQIPDFKAPENAGKFDAVMKLAEFDRQLLAARSALTWQLLALIWGAQAAVLLGGDKLTPAMQVLFGVITTAGGNIWIWWHWRRYEDDAKSMWALANGARDMIDAPRQASPHESDRYHLVNWMQVGVTVSLAMGIGLHVLFAC
jgi:hypothetical protein